jgi:hypothetical protein
LHKSLTDFYQAKIEIDEEEIEQDTSDIPIIENVPTYQKDDDDLKSS